MAEIDYSQVTGLVHSTESFGSVDGPGIRFIVFMQGCKMRCQYCHNPDTWTLDGNKDALDFTPEEVVKKISRFRSYFEKSGGGVTFSGGDPLHPSNISAVTALARKIKEKYPNKTIWLYTGSLWEEIQHEEILHYLDVLVDGEFQVDKLDVGLKWKGSSNQRVIDVPSTLCEHRIVLHAE